MNTVSCNSTRSAVPPLTDWSDVDWHFIETYVRKLQQRIYRAESQGNARKTRNLQRLLIRSRAALLLGIKRVTQINQGKRTAGVDGYRVLSPAARVDLYNKMKDQHLSNHNPKPTRRTYIPKKNGKLRPLGIPTVKDRVWQYVAKLALEPQWEERFESISYGFRPKRSIHDAVGAIFIKLNGRNNKKKWVFEGDFKGCFDNLDHSYIYEQIKTFPTARTIKKWLQAGYIDNGVFHNTEAGTPQGGIISPLLANIALHGMEKEVGVQYQFVKPYSAHPEGFWKVSTPYSVVRYADDFVILCETKEEAASMYDRLKPYLQKRGLTLAEDKTKVTNVTEGFDFLGFTFRKWETHKRILDTNTGYKQSLTYYKTLVKPSKKSVNKARADLKEVFKVTRGSSVDDLIKKLNPILRGKANVWKHTVSKKTLAAMDYYIWIKVKTFLKALHPKKSQKWIVSRYFRSDVTGQSKNAWILSSPNQKYLQLVKMAWTENIRHDLVKFKATPFDPCLGSYYRARAVKNFNSNNIASRQKLAKKQKYKCPLCGMSLVETNESYEVHHRKPRVHGGDNSYKNLWLVHSSCHTEHHRIFPAKGPIPTGKQLLAHKRRLAYLRRMNGNERSYFN
ncbi:group II intron reverse transcriptase/maturase [Paenibacillus sp. URB8-2]|uniref:group II intron reverse transcriptase/maturase n=1 Tax=Paenibacillus sp. URB8-2 TaxID=2741301 RepID=UPI0015B87F2F|nr:group II intron reverse transcriptase/maturase [Paenibacillus sp. URB8-2]BCG57021.1 group II intron reverse transcriptase/maturase [Paenibacillus sp. URB8-2]